jgi:hypothetical protein
MSRTSRHEFAEMRGRRRWGRWAAGLALAISAGTPAPSVAEPTETRPEAVASDPDYAAGKQALERKDWGEAVRRFRQAALRDPDNADLQNTSGSPIETLVSSTPRSSTTDARSSSIRATVALTSTRAKPT